MKKLLTFLMLGLSLFAFSCKNVSDSDTGSSETGGGGSEQKKEEKTLDKKEIYKSLLGSYKNTKEYVPSDEVETLILAWDSVTINGTRYSFNPDTDIPSVKDFPQDHFVVKHKYIDDFATIIFIKVNGTYYEITYADHKGKYSEQSKDFDITLKDYPNGKWGPYLYYLKKVSSSEGDSPSQNPSADFSGTYTIKETHTLGDIKLNDGKWSLTEGSASGTYSLNDKELTVSSTKGGHTSSAVFTLVVSGKEVTLKYKSGDGTAIISLFGVKDSSALVNATITLVKK